MANQAATVESFQDFADGVHRYATAIEDAYESQNLEAALKVVTELSGPDLAETVYALKEPIRLAVFNALSEDIRNDALETLRPEHAADIITILSNTQAVRILDMATPKTAANILRVLDNEDATRLLAEMDTRAALGQLLLYSDDRAGGLMDTNVTVLRDNWPVGYAVNVMRMSGGGDRDVGQVFVIDENSTLVGQTTLTQLVFAPRTATVKDIAKSDVISVTPSTNREQVVLTAQRYHLTSLPVVDEAGKLEGAIALEDLLDASAREATEDMYRMVGITGSERSVSTLRVSIKNRLPWLIVNVGTVAIVSAAIGLFENTLEAVTVLAVYLPMVMNQAGVIGTQITTIVVRLLAIGEIPLRGTWHLLFREYSIAAVNGLAVSLVMALIVGVWQGDLFLAGVIFFSMYASYFIATSVGVLIPLLMARLRIDPATASGVILTTVTDLAGGISYLGLATVFLRFL